GRSHPTELHDAVLEPRTWEGLPRLVRSVVVALVGHFLLLDIDTHSGARGKGRSLRPRSGCSRPRRPVRLWAVGAVPVPGCSSGPSPTRRQGESTPPHRRAKRQRPSARPWGPPGTP